MGRVLFSCEGLAHAIGAVGGKVIDTKINFMTQNVEFVIEHEKCPEVIEGEIIPRITLEELK